MKARIVPGPSPCNEVHVPESIAKDELALAEVATYSLQTYRQLVKGTTSVEACVVRVEGARPPREVRVTVSLCEMLARTRAGVRQIQAAMQRLGLTSPQVEVLGLGRTGAVVRVTARALGGHPVPLAERTVAAISSLAHVGRVEVELRSPVGHVSRRGGRDVP